ncbi:hypothetical protein D3C75_1288840 [compost metagenome]
MDIVNSQIAILIMHSIYINDCAVLLIFGLGHVFIDKIIQIIGFPWYSYRDYLHLVRVK